MNEYTPSEFDRMVAEFGSRQELWKHLFSYREGELFWIASRGTAKAGGLAGNGTSGCGYWKVKLFSKNHNRSRIVWELHYGDLVGETEVDHIDFNRQNDKIENLRACTSAENSQHQGLRSNSTSGFIGVSWHKQSERWHACIQVAGKRIPLGGFSTAEEAAKAYDAAALKYHGAFAVLNFPELHQGA
jgi:hypothetical protein